MEAAAEQARASGTQPGTPHTEAPLDPELLEATQAALRASKKLRDSAGEATRAFARLRDLYAERGIELEVKE